MNERCKISGGSDNSFSDSTMYSCLVIHSIYFNIQVQCFVMQADLCTSYRVVQIQCYQTFRRETKMFGTKIFRAGPKFSKKMIQGIKIFSEKIGPGTKIFRIKIPVTEPRSGGEKRTSSGDTSIWTHWCCR